MKRLWVKYLSLLLILAQTSVLFADTLTFNNGQKINGKLISISEEHELDPNTGVTSEVTFKVDDYQLKMISEELIVGKVDNSTLMFDKKSIYKITDDRGTLLFTHNKKLMDSKDFDFIELATKVQERQKTLSPSERFGKRVVFLGGCFLVYMLLFIEF
ncbi:hypothetical protein OAQ57_01235 [Candidatus Marinimicrobia bacterium]|nr:hypothetical protein [Candidatus Neomarinimicrobiota bacterium]